MKWIDCSQLNTVCSLPERNRCWRETADWRETAELWEDKDCQGRNRWARRQPYNGHQNALALKTSLHTTAIVTVTFASAQRDYGHCVQSCHEASHCYPRTENALLY